MEERAPETLGERATSFSLAFHIRATSCRSWETRPIHSSYQALAPMVFQRAWYSPRYPMERRESAPSEQELR
jgi:hypothetical protein